MMKSPFLDRPHVFVTVNPDSAGWAVAHLSEFHAALPEIGVEATLVFAKEGQGTLNLSAHRNPVVVDMNCKSRFPARTRRFSMMVDHPVWGLRHLEGQSPNELTLGWVDQGHPEIMRRLEMPFVSTFLPHAGPRPATTPKSMADRTLDVLFVGNFATVTTKDAWLARRPAASPVTAEVLFQTIDALNANSAQDPLVAVISALGARGASFSKADLPALCSLAADAQEISETLRRYALLETIAALPGITLHLCSNELPSVLADAPSVTWHGYVTDFAEVRALMGDARIVLNTTNKFPRGAHERIWYAMAESTVVLTDQSSYMAADFVDGRDILYLPDGPSIAGALDYLPDLIHSPGRLEGIASAAMPIYAAKHCWNARIHSLLTF